MTIRLLAPAKINLGLEVIRKRDDGFHDIATVFQTISVFDRLRITPADTDSVEIAGSVDRIEENLVSKAIELARDAGRCRSAFRIEIEKRIPMAAGLGGASADAAAVLSALAIENNSSRSDFADLALQIGSDVPFLLQGGAAFATGRGELLERLPSLSGCWFVLASPVCALERKTARLFGSLQQADLSTGDRVNRVVAALSSGLKPSPDDLANAFSRPLREILPETLDLIDAFDAAGAPLVALSGAGPTHYTIIPRLSDALFLAQRLSRHAPIPMRVLVGRPVATGMQVRVDKTRILDPAL